MRNYLYCLAIIFVISNIVFIIHNDVLISNEFTEPNDKAQDEVSKPDNAYVPPTKFQKDIFVGVRFGDKANIPDRCDDKDAYACEYKDGKKIPLLELPNPCSIPEAYAQSVCHELGHANGWGGHHINGHFVPVSFRTYSFSSYCKDQFYWAETISANSSDDAKEIGLRDSDKYNPKCKTIVNWTTSNIINYSDNNN